MKKITVCVVLFRGMDVGSSRIRYRTLKALPCEFEVRVVDANNDLNCDILYIQKKSVPKYIEFAKRVREKGIPLVFDEDDDFGEIPGMNEKEMCKCVDAIIVDTEARKSHVQSITDIPIFVVPTAIDYVESPGISVDIRESICSIVTFGNEKSIPLAKPYLEKLKRSYSLFQISSKNINGWNFIRWSLGTFIRELIKHDVCFLAHSRDMKGNRKSPVRLITSMSVGLPSIVSDTKSFREVMEAVGHPELIAKSPDDVPAILKYISSQEIRKKISQDFIEYAWKEYSQNKAAALLADALREVIANKIRSV